MSLEFAISNSSPLIYLAKLNRLSLLKSLSSQVIIPVAVYNEVVSVGIRGGHSEAKMIELAIEDRWIKVRKAKRVHGLRSFPELDVGELKVLSLARQLHAPMVLIDDASARLAAEALGFNSKGTIYVILRSAQTGIVTKPEAKHLITELVSAGFWLSGEVVGKILNELG